MGQLFSTGRLVAAAADPRSSGAPWGACAGGSRSRVVRSCGRWYVTLVASDA